MKHLCRVLLLLSTLFFLGAGIASADSMPPVLSYQLSQVNGPFSASFELPAGQLTIPAGQFDLGFGFIVTPVTGTLVINGTSSGDFLAFYNSAFLGGFGAFSSGSSLDFKGTGPQLYSGIENSPSLSVGTFSLLAASGAKYTLTVAPVSTPEPSALVLLSVGMLALGLAAVRFKGRFPIAAT